MFLPCCSASGFIAFSTNPTLAKKIKTFYALAPVATVNYNKSPLRKLAFISSSIFKVCDSLGLRYQIAHLFQSDGKLKTKQNKRKQTPGGHCVYIQK